MAYFTGLIPDGAITRIDSSNIYGVMTQKQDSVGNVYIYLKGVASTLANSVVTYDELGISTLLAANAIGPVAIAQAVTVADTYGWYLISGSCLVQTAGDVADNALVYATATGGKVDDAVVAGDRVKRALFRAAGTGATTVLAQVWYAEMDDASSA